MIANPYERNLLIFDVDVLVVFNVIDSLDLHSIQCYYLLGQGISEEFWTHFDPEAVHDGQ